MKTHLNKRCRTWRRLAQVALAIVQRQAWFRGQNFVQAKRELTKVVEQLEFTTYTDRGAGFNSQSFNVSRKHFITLDWQLCVGC